MNLLRHRKTPLLFQQGGGYEKVVCKDFYSKHSIKSKQFALTNLVANSTKVTNQIQTNITNLQSTNSEIDATLKEIEDMKTQYSILERELENRKKDNENIIAMFSVKK